MNDNIIRKLRLENFTAFKDLEMDFAPGLNVIIGANSTGKTHILKVLYSICKALGEPSDGEVWDQLIGNFMPYDGFMGALVHHGRSKAAKIELSHGDHDYIIDVDHNDEEFGSIAINPEEFSDTARAKCVYIPSKDIMVHAPGFRSLYKSREVSFERLYVDLLDNLFLPRLRDHSETQKGILKKIETIVGGSITVRGEHFFLKSKDGDLEFSLLSEGYRKFGMVWLLINNGVLAPGSLLFWDEPETNLNPKLQGIIVDVLMVLQRAGVQVFIATHNYVLLKEIDLRTKEQDKGRIAFHSLYRDKKQIIKTSRSESYLQIEENVIEETFLDLYNRQLDREIEGGQS